MRNLDKKAQTDPVIYLALKVYFSSLIVPEKKKSDDGYSITLHWIDYEVQG